MITLRDYTKNDINRLAELANNKNISRYLVDTFPFPYTQADAEYWLETGCSENGSIVKVIEYQGEFVGSVGIKPQSGWKSHVAEIGYWVAESYWGKGIASCALNRMTEISLAKLNYRKLFAPVLAPNVASMRVLEKCGYSLEGVLRQDVFKDGWYFDIHHYAIIASNA
jgi:[ribosomal protein S5]-alanine N-acetyltransferase